MASVPVRLLGGVLNGQVVWVDETSPTVRVHVSSGTAGRKVLSYERDGAVARLLAEPAAHDTPNS